MGIVMNIKCAIILCAITKILAATDVCSAKGQLTDQQIWNFFVFSPFQTYFTITVGAIAVLLLIISLLTWLCFPSFSMPSDIIFVLLIGTLLDNITLLIEAVYSKINSGTDSQNGFVSFCSATGFFNMLGNIICLYYNALFCGALAYSIHNTIYKPYFTVPKLHLLCLTVIIFAIAIVLFTTNAGEPFNNLCIYRLASPSSLGLFLIHLILTFFTLYSLNKFRSKIPSNSFFEKQSHFRYYYLYMVVFSIVEGINTLLYLIGNLSCQTNNSHVQTVLQIQITITNCITVLLAFASVALRLGHPFIFHKIKRLVRDSSLFEEQYENEKEQFNWMSSLVDSIKGCQVLSFIQAIMINYIEHIKKHPKALDPYHFQRQYSFIIDQHVAEDYIKRRITNRDSHFAKRLSDGLTTLKYEVTIYTPEFYSWLFQNQKINLFSSFDLRKNLDMVKEESFTNGGKSGEFFFGTFDHKFIFKTIQPYEAQVFLGKTQQFYKYFAQNHDTLLIKLLGLYRFERKDIKNEIIYLIIMKNLTMCHKSSNLRVYDLKGSAYNRSTLKEKKIKSTDQDKLRKFTLKDKDFLLLEQKVAIQPSQAEKLRQILIRDLRFLSEQGVMDYSLLIIKRQGKATGQRGEFRSAAEPQVLYHFGIIDYLEEWTMKRKAERVFKTMITNEEVTAQSPEAYSERLIGLINQII